jgi:hypothetical protein
MNNYLFRTHDPRLFEVILHRSRYHNHIWMQHGIVIEAIQAAIEDPDLITADVQDPYKENYYAKGVIPGHPDVLLKVCVLFKQDVGRVLTAFAAEMPKIGEEMLWQR